MNVRIARYYAVTCLSVWLTCRLSHTSTVSEWMNPDGFGEFIVTAEPANQLALIIIIIIIRFVKRQNVKRLPWRFRWKVFTLHTKAVGEILLLSKDMLHLVVFWLKHLITDKYVGLCSCCDDWPLPRERLALRPLPNTNFQRHMGWWDWLLFACCRFCTYLFLILAIRFWSLPVYMYVIVILWKEYGHCLCCM